MNIDQSKPIRIQFQFHELAVAMAEQLCSNGFIVNDSREDYTDIVIMDNALYLHSGVEPTVAYQPINGCQHWPELRDLKPIVEWEVREYDIGPGFFVHNNTNAIHGSGSGLYKKEAQAIADALNSL